MSLIVHPHFHRRRTGVTRHVEEVVPALDRLAETRAIGSALGPSVPRIGWAELWRRLRSEPVIWHAHRNNELLAGLLLRLVSRQLRVVFTRHGGKVPGRYTRALSRRADRLVTLTRVVARNLGLPSAIVSHGVDLSRFRPPGDRAAAWRALGLGGLHGIGVVGRIRPDKGQGDFTEAIRPLLQRFPDWRAVLVGLAKGGDAAWAEGLRRSTGDALVLAGEHGDIVPWYQGLTIAVQPSHLEAYSLVLVESMASGCCVVATALEQHPDVVEHGRTGFLYPPGDAAALREILALLMAEPARAEAIGRNAAEEARARFGLEHEVRGLLDVYRELRGG